MNKQEFEASFARYAGLAEEGLADLLPDGSLPQSRVIQAMGYSLLGGGKRIRAVLVLAFCRLCGGNEQEALPFACAIEMLHAYSLIHDDLPCMDNDDLRRGKPACHIAFGQATALLAGDALLTLAFEVMLQQNQTLAPERRLAAAGELARAAGVCGMVGGQVLDLAYETQPATMEQIEHMQALKTGALLRAAAKMGCIVAGASPAQLQNADAYATALGLAFQIVDDILDVTADPKALGKPVGSDIKNHKATYVAQYGLERARQRVQELSHQAAQALADGGEEREFLLRLLDMLAQRSH